MQFLFGQRHSTSPAVCSAGDPHEGHFEGGSIFCAVSERSIGSTATIFGIISPPFPRLHGHQGEGSGGLPDYSYAGLLVRLLYRSVLQVQEWQPV